MTSRITIADLFNTFCEEVYVIVFFKIVRQQTTGEWQIQLLFVADNLILLATVKELLKLDSIYKSYAQMKKKMFTFSDSQCTLYIQFTRMSYTASRWLQTERHSQTQRCCCRQ